MEAKSKSLKSWLFAFAKFYQSQDRYQQAENLYRQSLAESTTFLGEEHPLTLTVVNGYGTLLRIPGRLPEAKRFYQRASTGREKIFGVYHPKTLNSLHNLANLSAEMGQLDLARDLYLKVLEIRENVQGRGSAPTLDTLNDLASLYCRLNLLADAELLYSRALRGKESTLGATNLSTLRTANNYGNLLCQCHRLIEAEQMYKRALAGYELILGPSHTLVLDTVYNLGILSFLIGRGEEAERLHKRALEGRQRILGPDHPSTQASMDTITDLALALQGQGNMQNISLANAHTPEMMDGMEKPSQAPKCHSPEADQTQDHIFTSINEKKGFEETMDRQGGSIQVGTSYHLTRVETPSYSQTTDYGGLGLERLIPRSQPASTQQQILEPQQEKKFQQSYSPQSFSAYEFAMPTARLAGNLTTNPAASLIAGCPFCIALTTNKMCHQRHEHERSGFARILPSECRNASSSGS
ncbi:MAG: hypothetical protein M1819_001562 [Sarea resinae]|nr:MAG: hypothetical protein M1819_001562 [Sarea resinae]